jgi:hypothetical protein
VIGFHFFDPWSAFEKGRCYSATCLLAGKNPVIAVPRKKNQMASGQVAGAHADGPGTAACGASAIVVVSKFNHCSVLFSYFNR